MKLIWNTNKELNSFWGEYHYNNSKKWIFELLENIEFEEIGSIRNIVPSEKIIIVDSELPRKQNFYSNLFKNHKNLFLIHLGDEGGQEYNDKFYNNFKHIFRPFFLKKFKTNKKITFIPLGYKTGKITNDIKLIDRKYIWNFMGTIHGASRYDMTYQNKMIKPNFVNITKNFSGDGTISGNDYYEIQRNSKFSLVPHGYLHPETYRLYEGLECGSIPIIENPYNFFDDIFPKNHFYKINLWNEARNIIEKLINDRNKLTYISKLNYDWWINFKKNLRNKIKDIIHV